MSLIVAVFNILDGESASLPPRQGRQAHMILVDFALGFLRCLALAPQLVYPGADRVKVVSSTRSRRRSPLCVKTPGL